MLSPIGENLCHLAPPSLPIGCGLILNRSVTLVENTETFEKPKCFVETATPSQYANSVQISFDEFLKLLEFSDRRPSSRCETAETRRVFNFLPRPIRQMPSGHCRIQSMVYDLLTNYRGEWNDYDVPADGVVVGGIFKTPVGEPWMWNP